MLTLEINKNEKNCWKIVIFFNNRLAFASGFLEIQL